MELNDRELQVMIEEKKQELTFLTKRFDLKHEKVLMCSQDLDFLVNYLIKKSLKQKNLCKYTDI